MRQYKFNLRDAVQQVLKNQARRARLRAEASRQAATLREDRAQRRGEERARRRLKASRDAQERAALRAQARAAYVRPPLRVLLRRSAPGALAAVAALSLAGNVLQYFHSSTGRTLVTVGPRVVRQREYLADLDAAAGKAVLGRIVYGELVRQAAERAGVFPTPAQVDARLAGAGGTPDRGAVELQMALENLRLRGVTATDAEVASYYAANRAQLTVPGHVTASAIVTAGAADAARAAHLLAAGKTDAQIAALPGMRVAGVGGFQIHVEALPPALRDRLQRAAFTAPLGTIQTLPCPDGTFLTVQAHQRSPASVPPLALARDQVARLVRLRKAPSEQALLAQLYRDAPPTFEMSRYAQFFGDVQSSSPADAPQADAPQAGPPLPRRTAALPATGAP